MSRNLAGIRTVIIDNYDSYTFNLLQLCPDPSNVVIIRNDQFTWSHFVSNVLPHFDNIIISPGPGRPEHANDFGICTQLLQAQREGSEALQIPIFGVCLGHQGIALIFGGKVKHAKRIMHGRMSQIVREDPYANGDVLDNLPLPFWAVRYHSLVADEEALPPCLEVTAYCYENDVDVEALEQAHYVSDQGDIANCFLDEPNRVPEHPSSNANNSSAGSNKTIMAFRHQSLPIWGVQFHPESICTEYGSQMVENFMHLTADWMSKSGRAIREQVIPSKILNLSVVAKSSIDIVSNNTTIPKYELHIKPIDIKHLWVNPAELFEEIIAAKQSEQLPVSWLDSNMSRSPYSNNTILSVEPSFTVTYSTLHKEITTTAGSQTTKQYLSSEETFFDHVSGIMSQYNSIPHKVIGDDEDLRIPSMSFRGGLIGYFGYEMKRESMTGYHVPDEQKCSCHLHKEGKQTEKNCCRCNEVPDAAFHFVDKFFAFDHKERCINICCLVRHGDEGIVGVAEDVARTWVRTNEQLLVSVAEKLRRKKLERDFISLSPASSRGSTPDVMPILKQEVFTPDTTHDKYIESIENCVHQIREGESYEICLTTQFRHQLDKGIARSACDTQLTKLYTRHLRMNNPAPFSAVLSFPSCQMSLMSSSPERFLKVDSNGVVEMKPIKGTVKRCLECVCDEHEGIECDMDDECNCRIIEEDERRMQTLWSDVKERAENLMIVDLIRNDLAQFCIPTTVSVPKLMHVETYEKVHHLVSTVCAQLRPDIDSVRAVQNSFPPGSMTGAPKLRSVQILDNVEHHIPRGIYSGCLGYFSIGDASSSTGKTTAQFSVVIRTAVASTKPSHVELSIGGGGAITFLSNPENEWHEVLLKTKSVAPSVKEFIDNAPVTYM